MTPDNVIIYFIEKNSINGETRHKNIFNIRITRNSVVQVTMANHDSYDLDDFGENEYCEFEMLFRGHNCAILWSTNKICV